MHWIDLAILLIILLSVITGLFRGFVKEFMSLCTWILAFWMAYAYSPEVASWLQTYVQDMSLRSIIAFVLIVFGVLIIGGIINSTLSFILRRTGLSGTDRSLGMVFGFIRGIFIVALIMVGIKMTSLPYEQYARSSMFYNYFSPLAAKIEAFMPAFIKQVQAVDVHNALANAAGAFELNN